MYEFQKDFLQFKNIFPSVTLFSKIKLIVFIFNSRLAIFLHLQIKLMMDTCNSYYPIK